jgi:hypothetical protein
MRILGEGFADAERILLCSSAQGSTYRLDMKVPNIVPLIKLTVINTHTHTHTCKVPTPELCVLCHASIVIRI